MRTTSATATLQTSFNPVIAAARRLWRRHHLAYDQACYVAKGARRALALARPKARKRVAAHLSRAGERVLIQHAHHLFPLSLWERAG